MRKHSDCLVDLRRDFHKHAELSFQEHRTATVIAERLSAAGLEMRTGIAGPGVVGVLRGDKPGRVVAWRTALFARPATRLGKQRRDDFPLLVRQFHGDLLFHEVTP